MLELESEFGGKTKRNGWIPHTKGVNRGNLERIEGLLSKMGAQVKCILPDLSCVVES